MSKSKKHEEIITENFWKNNAEFCENEIIFSKNIFIAQEFYFRTILENSFFYFYKLFCNIKTTI